MLNYQIATIDLARRIANSNLTNRRIGRTDDLTNKQTKEQTNVTKQTDE